MDVLVQEYKTHIVVAPQGSLDMYASLDLKNRVDALDFQENQQVVFDLAGLDFIDSSGIGALIRIVSVSKKKQIKFFIMNLRPMIEKVFKVAGLINYFKIITPEEYEARFNANA